MKILSFLTLLFFSFIINGLSQNVENEANVLVSFLEGKWENYSIILSDKQPVQKVNYNETMNIKNDSTISITAHEFNNGEDLTKDMILVLHQDEVSMSQGSFTAKGRKEGNVYYLTGHNDFTEYRFRLYTMGDKYIFHNEVWKDGEIIQINMSYLLRKK